MAGTSVHEVLLAEPIYSNVDVVPFCSEKDRYSLFPVDGLSVTVTFFKQMEVAHYVHLFYQAQQILGVLLELNLGPH